MRDILFLIIVDRQFLHIQRQCLLQQIVIQAPLDQYRIIQSAFSVYLCNQIIQIHFSADHRDEALEQCCVVIQVIFRRFKSIQCIRKTDHRLIQFA